MIYIEQYKYENNYNITEFFGGLSGYQKHWPAVFVSSTRLNYPGWITMVQNLLNGEERSKPLMCLANGPESVHNEMAKLLGMQGITFSVLSACTSSAYAIYQAGLISADQGTPVVVACADTFSPAAMHWFNSLGAVSPDTGIPFDKNSRGFRPGLAQAMFVVSAKPINPVACISNMRFMTQPAERTAVGSIDEIKNMFEGINLDNISWCNAHAPGTRVGDTAEFKLFSSFNKDIPISSLKGKLGHALASSYLLELGAAIDMVSQTVAPANVGIKDPIVDDDRIITSDVYMNTKKFIKFNMGFGGKNVLSVIDVFK